MAEVVVIGIGNDLRHDDAAGLEVARRVRSRMRGMGVAVHELAGEPIGLVDAWEGAAAAVLVDALRSGAPAGSVHRFDASSEPLPDGLRGRVSTHALDVGEAIELARAVDLLPPRVVLYGVEGGRFGTGRGLSDEVAAAVEPLAEAVLREAAGPR